MSQTQYGEGVKTDGSLVEDEHALVQAAVAADGTAIEAAGDVDADVAVVVWQQSLIPIESVSHCFLHQQFAWGLASWVRRQTPLGSSG